MMVITTESGSRYEISRGILHKRDSTGRWVDSFKVFSMKAVPKDYTTMAQLYALENGDPEVGKHLFISGRDSWWLSTEVVSIEFFEDKDGDGNERRHAGPEDFDS